MPAQKLKPDTHKIILKREVLLLRLSEPIVCRRLNIKKFTGNHSFLSLMDSMDSIDVLKPTPIIA
jgi:hypothetical protein